MNNKQNKKSLLQKMMESYSDIPAETEIFPVLKTSRLELVEMTHEHADDIYALFSDEKVMQYYNELPYTFKEQAHEFIDWQILKRNSKTGLWWGIKLKGQSSIIGAVGYSHSMQEGNMSSIGFVLGYDYWNKRYMTEALITAADYGFKSLEINRIEALVMPPNIEAIRVFEKLGFKCEGIVKDRMYWNDRFYDMSVHFMLKGEFDAMAIKAKLIRERRTKHAKDEIDYLDTEKRFGHKFHNACLRPPLVVKKRPKQKGPENEQT